MYFTVFVYSLADVGRVSSKRPPSFLISAMCVFFLCPLCWRFVNFIDLIKEPAFCFIDFSHCFSVQNFINFCPYLYYFHSSACFWFILFFFQCLEVSKNLGD